MSLDLTYDVNIGQDNILLQSGKVSLQFRGLII